MVGLRSCFTEPIQAAQIVYVESLTGKLRNEFLNNNRFYLPAEARKALEDWRMKYNTDRPHSSPGYKPTSEF